MVINIFQIALEYLAIIICLHRLAKKTFIINLYTIFYFVITLLAVIMSKVYLAEYLIATLSIYGIFLIYVRHMLRCDWREALRVWGSMLVLMPSMEFICFYIVKFISQSKLPYLHIGIIVNMIISILFLVWREEYICIVGRKIKKWIGIILAFIFLLCFAYLLETNNNINSISSENMLLLLGGILGVSVAFILFLYSETERKSREKELKLYEIYNSSFENAIITIRQRQHEFDNHISAIKSLQYTMSEPTELIIKQNEYCEAVIKENSLNRLLKLNIEPIVLGVLYSKLLNAQSMGIDVLQEVHAINFKDRVELIDLVEILNILIDNAVEALMTQEERMLRLRLIYYTENKFIIEVANSMPIIPNSILEKFFHDGYSTKGKNRGMGLGRAKVIVKKYKTNISVENVLYDNRNYVCFKIVI